MKITSAFVLCLVGVADGWVLSPRRACIKRRIKKSIVKKGLIGASAAAIGGAALVTTGAVGAVVYNQINNREVYKPATGSMSEYLILSSMHTLYTYINIISYHHFPSITINSQSSSTHYWWIFRAWT